MKLTNKHGLPEILVRAVERAGSEYSRGQSDITVTELIGPPRLRRFVQEYGHAIEEDVTDRLASFVGTAMHSKIERGQAAHDIVEERMYLDVLGWRLGGQFDHYEEGVVRDWKHTSVWSWIHEPHGKPEYVAQGNVNAHLLRHAGFSVDRIELVYVFSDFSKSKARTTQGYPRAKAAVIRVDDWGAERTQAYIEHRVKLHQAARQVRPEDVPVCSDQERWMRDAKFAVMKEGRKTAVRLLDSELEALAYISDNGLSPQNHSVVYRPGEYVRCLDWCPARELCSHGLAAAEAS